MWEAALLFIQIMAILIFVTLVVVFGTLAAWYSWWMVKIKDHPDTIMIDCRDESCHNKACIVVRYSSSHGPVLKLHGTVMDVIKVWRHALRNGIVKPAHEEVST